MACFRGHAATAIRERGKGDIINKAIEETGPGTRQFEADAAAKKCARPDCLQDRMACRGGHDLFDQTFGFFDGQSDCLGLFH
jgi:hypothetical protein